jgi:hypothetical protein
MQMLDHPSYLQFEGVPIAMIVTITAELFFFYGPFSCGKHATMSRIGYLPQVRTLAHPVNSRLFPLPGEVISWLSLPPSSTPTVEMH